MSDDPFPSGVPKATTWRLRLGVSLLAVLALLSLARLLDNAFGPTGGLDFHSYWYFGHFVRQGLNPYQVYAEGAPLSYPIVYLDGLTLSGPPFAQDGLAITPANTAPIVLLLTSLAFFSWPVARTLWLIVNVATIVTLPWVAMRLLPASQRPSRLAAALVAVAFYAFQSTRVAAWIGQTTLIIFLLMLLALHWRHRPIVAGLLLGVALAKYSLALPVALIFLVERRWLAVAIAGLVQLGGLLAVTALGSYTLADTLSVYAALLARHADQPGIQLAAQAPGGLVTAVVAGVGLTAVVTFLLWRRRVPAGSFLLLAVGAVWALLVAYHRAYDALVAVLFVIVAVGTWQRPAAWGVSRRAAGVAGWSAAGAIALLILPGEIVNRFLPVGWRFFWPVVSNILLTVGLLAMLLLLLLGPLAAAGAPLIAAPDRS